MAAETDSSTPPEHPKYAKRRRSRRRVIGMFLLIVLSGLLVARGFLPQTVRWYVNRTLDRDPNYDGAIGEVTINLWRGAYSIEDIRINKTIGRVPVPLFSAKRLDLAVEWDSLMKGQVVGRALIDTPQLNFVDGEEATQDQTGAGRPWLGIVQDLFPFQINSARIVNGSVRFHAPQMNPPVEMSLTQLNAAIDNLTNVTDSLIPLPATVTATGMAMDQAPVEMKMNIDPLSYRPTFEVAFKMVGLDVTKTNPLTRAYGAFDFEHGWFDLVLEVDAKEGALDGYVKPLFRNIRIISLQQDLAEDNIFQVFWESLVGGATEVLSNQPRDQFGTIIPFTGSLNNPQTDILATLGNVLHNAFIRAYLPRVRGGVTNFQGLDFRPGSIVDPGAPGAGI